MTHPPLISELQDMCWSIERISQQLTNLILLTHPYQPLLSLLQRNSLEVCTLLKNNFFTPSAATLEIRIHELTQLITLMRDYAFEGIDDEIIDSHLEKIKEGFGSVLELITQSLLENDQEESTIVMA